MGWEWRLPAARSQHPQGYAAATWTLDPSFRRPRPIGPGPAPPRVRVRVFERTFGDRSHRAGVRHHRSIRSAHRAHGSSARRRAGLSGRAAHTGDAPASRAARRSDAPRHERAHPNRGGRLRGSLRKRPYVCSLHRGPANSADLVSPGRRKSPAPHDRWPTGSRFGGFRGLQPNEVPGSAHRAPMARCRSGPLSASVAGTRPCTGRRSRGRGPGRRRRRSRRGR